MSKLEINILGKNMILDTYDGDKSISLNYQISDIKDISKKKTNYSKTITLPGTPINNIFFKQSFDVNIDTIQFNPTKSIKCVLRVGLNEVMSGYLQLKNIIINNDSVEYEINVMSKLQSILTSFGNKTLTSLTFTELNHNRNKTNIIDSWTNTEGYVYPFINRGGNNNINTEMLVGDMYPALFLKTVIDKMFESAGYEYKSSFFESDYFKSLIMPFVGDKFQKDATQVESNKMIVAPAYTQAIISQGAQNHSVINSLAGPSTYDTNVESITIPMGLENGVFGGTTLGDGDSQYTIPSNFVATETNYYDIILDISCLIRYDISGSGWTELTWDGDGGTQASFILHKLSNGVDTIIDSYDVNVTPSNTNDHPAPWNDTDGRFQVYMSVNNIHLLSGDVVYVESKLYNNTTEWDNGVYFDAWNRNYLYMSKFNTDGDISKFSIRPTSNNINANTTIDFASIVNTGYKQKNYSVI